MAEDKIEVVIVADDSGLNESLQRQAQNFEDLAAEAKQTGKAIDNSLKPRNAQAYGAAVQANTKDLQNQGRQIKKNTGNFSKFNKAGGRGISMLSRFSGVGGRATRSLGGLAFALGGSPFGAFALAASAATLAYSFFAEQLGVDSAEIIKKNKELEASISSLRSNLTAGFQEGKLISIDLEVLKGLSEQEASLKRIEVFRQNIGRLQVDRSKDFQELSKLEVQLANNSISDSTKKLEAEKRVLEIETQRLSISNDISANEARIIKEELNQEQRRQQSSQARKKRAIEASKLFDSLIRGELEKRLKALDVAAEKRDKAGRENITNTKQLNAFLLESERVLELDKAKVREQFRQAELKARRALESQLVIDEEAAAIKAAQNSAEDRKVQINKNAKDEADKAELLRLNEAKLQSDLTSIRTKFADQRKQEGLKVEQEIFSIRSAAFEAQVMQEKAQLENELLLEKQGVEALKQTEEELTAFNKTQADKKLKQDLDFQIARLELAKKFNKELTSEETAALEAQIQLLKTRLKGVGAEVQAEAKSDSKAGGLFGLLGLTEDQAKNTEAIQGALQQATQAVSDAVGERVALLDQEINKRDENLENLQTNLSNELRLAELGKAANVKQVQDQIKKEKAARDKAAREKKEAAKAQFILDTALQTSNLVTAVSGLYKSLSSLPFGIGVALATALSGVMIGTFVASKVSAANAAGFAEGGQYGYTGDGSKYTESKTLGERPYDYHKGEYIMPKTMVEQYGLNGVPVSNVDQVLASHFSDSTPSLKATSRKNKSINKSISNNNKSKALALQNGVVSALNKQLPILQEIAEKPTAIVMPDGSTHVLTKGKIHIYKPK